MDKHPMKGGVYQREDRTGSDGKGAQGSADLEEKNEKT